MNRSTTFRKTEERSEFEQKLLDIARVARVTAGGKRFRFRAVIVIGDKKGRVGLGVAKGQDVAFSVEKAVAKAKKNLMTIPLVKGSIPYQVEAKFSSARVLLKPRGEGQGIVAGGVVRVICNLAGIENISAKILGRTTNKLNNARAVFKALGGLLQKSNF